MFQNKSYEAINIENAGIMVKLNKNKFFQNKAFEEINEVYLINCDQQRKRRHLWKILEDQKLKQNFFQENSETKTKVKLLKETSK